MAVSLTEREPAATTVVDERALRSLSSGRSVTLRHAGSDDLIEVRSPEGAVELTITLTEQGPVVKLSAARLELAATDTVAIACNKLDIRTEQETRIYSEDRILISGREAKLQTSDDIWMNAAKIRNQCP